MAVKLISNVNRWDGISSDEKPSTAPEGSTFHVVDTGEQYIWHNGTWELDLRLSTALARATEV